jgi:hypothetical protein
VVACGDLGGLHRQLLAKTMELLRQHRAFWAKLFNPIRAAPVSKTHQLGLSTGMDWLRNPTSKGKPTNPSLPMSPTSTESPSGV